MWPDTAWQELLFSSLLVLQQSLAEARRIGREEGNVGGQEEEREGGRALILFQSFMSLTCTSVIAVMGD